MSGSSSAASAQVTANANGRAALGGAYGKLPTRVLQRMGGVQTLPSPPLGSAPVTVTIYPRAVGLLRRAYFKVAVTFTVPAGTVLTPGKFGPASIASRVKFTDLNNLDRIDTSGYHLAFLNSVRLRQPVGSAFLTDTQFGFGNVYGGGIKFGGAITGTGQTVTMQMLYEVPIAYADGDYRGALYLGTTQAQAQFTLTMNPLMFAAAGADPTEVPYLYTGTAPTVTSIVVTSFQDYIDNIPTDSNGNLLLPWLDMGTIYQLIRTDNQGVVANNDFQIPFTNLRTFQSMFAIYDNGGVLNAGTDVNSWKMQIANMYTMMDVDVDLLSYRTRNAIGDDVPAGVYYFSFREAPINTSDYGNTYMILNASQANAGAKVTTLYEFFSSTYTLAGQAVSG